MMITAAMHCYCVYNDGVAGHHTLKGLSLSIFKQSVN